MNERQYWNALLAALGSTVHANNEREFWVAMKDVADTNINSASDVEAAVAAKTEIAALTSGSSAADIVAALQA